MIIKGLEDSLFRIKKEKKEMKSPVSRCGVWTDRCICAEQHSKPRNNLPGYQKRKHSNVTKHLVLLKHL